MKKNELYNNPRIIVVQKLYSNHFNKDTELVIPKNIGKFYFGAGYQDI